MQLEIRTPSQALFEGEASSLTCPGVDGSFQVLDHHAALLSQLSKGTLRYQTTEGVQTLEVVGGLVEVVRNKVIVLLETAV